MPSRFALITFLEGGAAGAPSPTPPIAVPPDVPTHPIWLPAPPEGETDPGYPIQLPVFPYDPTHPIATPPGRPAHPIIEPDQLFRLRWSPLYGWILVPNFDVPHVDPRA